MPKAGDIVFVKFPFAEKVADRLHPALVLDDLGDRRFVLAYGSSKHVDVSSPRNSEVIVSSAEDIAQCGLCMRTRFDLSVRAAMFVPNRAVAGQLPNGLLPRLFRVAKYCKLLGLDA